MLQTVVFAAEVPGAAGRYRSTPETRPKLSNLQAQWAFSPDGNDGTQAMMHTMEQESALFSPLASEPELAGLVKLFVEELPDRVETLRDSLERGDRETLARTAHQLKGAAGSYGFPAITPTASRLEFAARNREPDLHVLELVNDLVELCQRCRAGVPG